MKVLSQTSQCTSLTHLQHEFNNSKSYTIYVYNICNSFELSILDGKIPVFVLKVRVKNELRKKHYCFRLCLIASFDA